MSYISALLSKSITVPCQSDPEFSSQSQGEKVGSNQCSWCAGAFIERAGELIASFHKRDNFETIYGECLSRGSKLRAESGYLQYGENICNALLTRVMKLEIVAQYVITHRVDSDFSRLLPRDLADEFYREKNAIAVDDVDSWISNLINRGSKFMISRFGLSFAVLKLASGEFLVLDSHTKEIGVMSARNLTRYVRMDTSDNFIGYFQVCC